MKRSELIDEDCLNIRICISVFCDGANLFNNANNRFHALIIQILNLHPSRRIVDCVGSFVIALHNAYTMSKVDEIKGNAEKVLFQNFFYAELQKFERGVLWRIGTQQMFVQVAQIHPILDTVEVCKLCNINGQASKGPCAICGAIYGRSIKVIMKPTMIKNIVLIIILNICIYIVS